MISRLFFSLVLVFCVSLSSGGAVLADSFDPSSFVQIGVEEKKEDEIRVASFNVRFGDVNGVNRFKRADVVTKQLKELEADTFGVQEATPFWMNIIAAALPEYRHIGLGRILGKDGPLSDEHSAIFYNCKKLKLVTGGTFWLTSTPKVPSRFKGTTWPRICTWAVFEEKSSGVQFVHLNTHLDNASEEARDFGSKMILSFIEKNFSSMNVVLTGDFNSPSYEAAYKNIAAALRDASIYAADSKSFGTWHDGQPQNFASRIDYVFCSDELEISSFRTVTTGACGRLSSDHFPIYADLKLSNTAPTYGGKLVIYP